MEGEVAGCKKELREVRQRMDKQMERQRQQHKQEHQELLQRMDKQMERVRQQHQEELQRMNEQMQQRDELMHGRAQELQRSHDQIVHAMQDALLRGIVVPTSTTHDVHHNTVPAPPSVAQRAPPPAAPSVARVAGSLAPRQTRRVSVETTVSAESIALQLESGGDDAEATLLNVLEHALELTEAMALRTPRRQRKGVKALCSRLERMLEDSVVDLATRLATCELSQLAQLGHVLCAAHALPIDAADVDESVSMVESAMAELERCGDIVAAASRQLGSDAAEMRLHGLETIRNLPRMRLEESVSAEVELLPMLQELGMDESLSYAEWEAAWMSIFVIGLRHAVAAAPAVIEATALAMSTWNSFYRQSNLDVSDGRKAVRVEAAKHSLVGLNMDIVVKSDTAVRDVLHNHMLQSWKEFFQEAVQPAKELFEDLHPHILHGLADDDVALAAGMAWLERTALMIDAAHVMDPATLHASGLSTAALALHRQLTAGPLPAAAWWKARSQVVTQETACLNLVLDLCFWVNRKSAPHQQCDGTLAETVHLIKINREMELSAQDRAPAYTIVVAHIAVQDALAKNESKRDSLCATPGLVDALFYSTLHDCYPIYSNSSAMRATMILVTLIGRNESGITLSKSAIDIVLDQFHRYNSTDDNDWVSA